MFITLLKVLSVVLVILSFASDIVMAVGHAEAARQVSLKGPQKNPETTQETGMEKVRLVSVLAVSDAVLHRRTLPGAVGDLLHRRMPFPAISPGEAEILSSMGVRVGRVEWDVSSRSAKQASLKSSGRENVADVETNVARNDVRYVEIEVSHSAHTFKLMAGLGGGEKKVLYDCKVGLGGPGFPTPVGTYFVTHLYDDDPWWIPPKDRAWAAGDKPSRRVYGGTMAPLLKKRDIRSKKDTPETEDRIAGPVKLEDYGYRFHGTNAPRSIGRNQSHGCVRMLPNDARKVAHIIKEVTGTADRKESENGSYVVLNSPIRLNLIK